jgi:hypothetical protein
VGKKSTGRALQKGGCIVILDVERIKATIKSLESDFIHNKCINNTCLACSFQKEITSIRDLDYLFDNLLARLIQTEGNDYCIIDSSVLRDSFILGFELAWTYLKNEEIEKLCP